MGTIERFEEIRAWQTARVLTRQIYTLSNTRDWSRDFGFRDQIRRAAVSILSNIAEGFESDTQALFLKFLGYAKSSSGEVRAQLYVALDVAYITQEQFDTLSDLADKCSRQLSRFMQYLRTHHDSRCLREHQVVYEVAEQYNVGT